MSENSAVMRERIYAAIVRFKQAHDGLSPTVGELAEACALSVSSVKYHLLRLEIAGRIRSHGRRGLEVLGGAWSGPDSDPSASGEGPDGPAAAVRAALHDDVPAQE